MKITTFVKRLSGLAAVPLAWGLALIPSNPPASQQSPSEVTNVRSEIASERISIVHALLGDSIIPSGVTKEHHPEVHSPQQVAQGRGPATPPPPPPP
jgi:hypothetical protein